METAICPVCGKEFEREEKERLPKKKKKRMGERCCKHCGKSFVPTNSQQLYCGDQCARDHEKQKKKERYEAKKREMTAQCRMCGRVFEKERANQVYCCVECGYKAHMEAVKKYSREQREEKTEPEKKKQQKTEKNRLERLSAEATARGMTYGQYMQWRRENGLEER